ncbi:MAG TPA: hypothetical protein PL087_11180 [Bacteroidales bacterium]|nr:hypothetical protein [Bacteroidales bacterium]
MKNIRRTGNHNKVITKAEMKKKIWEAYKQILENSKRLHRILNSYKHG